ncbi:hypothetical protein HDU88_004499 [Geranomyces variabilis]|nr:inorganic phosphate transporter Pho88 [Geranomyces variabilis]KAJ3139345.1 hypothetical protein HDU90_000711 [Geranomyces variabilis]KAJ3173040.1 hypothetical protein HDU88_004499 [Geranomyces variabilis]
MNPAITNLVLVFGLMQVANKFELDKEENTNYLRMGYATMQLIAFASFALIYFKVTAKNDTTPLVYEEAKNPMNPTDVEKHATTVRDYDVKKIVELARSQAVSLGMIALMHFKFGYVRPLLLQSVLGLKSLYEAQLVQVHVLGKPAVAELARPWKVASPLAGLAPQADTTAKVADAKAAEKKSE